jgi:hypothetical protein
MNDKPTLTRIIESIIPPPGTDTSLIARHDGRAAITHIKGGGYAWAIRGADGATREGTAAFKFLARQRALFELRRALDRMRHYTATQAAIRATRTTPPQGTP